MKTCNDCEHFNKNCTLYPREVWPAIWLSNECICYKKKTVENLLRRKK